jgi:hypothetical protein
MLFLERRSELGFSGTEPVSTVYELCPYCGLVGKKPLPSEEELSAYYTSAWQAKAPREKVCYSSAADWIYKALRPLNKNVFDGLLDVGSADLSLTAALKEKFEIASSAAIDPQPRDSGVQQLASLKDAPSIASKPDLVCSTHVLEHVRNPTGFVYRLLDSLAPSGFLYIEVPAIEGGRSFCSDNVNRAHLWHFSLNAMVRIFNRTPVAYSPYGVVSVIAAETDLSILGWPVNRILVRKQSDEDALRYSDYRRHWARMMNAQEEVYFCAVRNLLKYDPEYAALYGASGSLFDLYKTAEKMGPTAYDKVRLFPVADLYKAGETLLGSTVRSPDILYSKTAAIVATRHPNSILDIYSFLGEHFPHIERVSLFDKPLLP